MSSKDEPVPAAAPQAEAAEGVPETSYLSIKKKKKKKKAVFPEDETEKEDQKEEANKKEDQKEKRQNEKEQEVEQEQEQEPVFVPAPKKKKAVRVRDVKEREGEEAPMAIPDDSDRDYTYMEMMERLYATLRHNHPDIDKPTQAKKLPVLRLVHKTKKTIWLNFKAYYETLHRDKVHLQSFIFAELSTTGALGADDTLKLNGKFPAAHLEKVLKKYIAEYVVCGMCKHSDTSLSRNAATRLYVLHCNNCRSDRTVSIIRAGFHATNRADRHKQKLALT